MPAVTSGPPSSLTLQHVTCEVGHDERPRGHEQVGGAIALPVGAPAVRKRQSWSRVMKTTIMLADASSLLAVRYGKALCTRTEACRQHQRSTCVVLGVQGV